MSPFTFPECLYGPSALVRSTVGRHATQILRNDSLDPVIRSPRIDVAVHPGSVVLARRWVTPAAAEPNFHADLLWKELERRVFKKVRGQEAFAQLRSLAERGLTDAWWFVGLLRSESYFLVRRAAEQLSFLAFARTHWDTLLSIGARYRPSAALENTPTLVQYCLARQGAPILNPPFLPLTSPRLNDLLDQLPGHYMRGLVAGGKIDEALRLLVGHAEITTVSLAEHLVDFGHDALACEAVRQLKLPDPHGIVHRWLAGEGDKTRTVS